MSGIHIPGDKILGTISNGGMAAVYLAEEAGLERKVALKVMHKVHNEATRVHSHNDFCVRQKLFQTSLILILFQLFRGQETPVLTDFGLAKIQSASTVLTMANMVIGTPSYMSPEQFESSNAGPASDIYSLGVVFVEML